ncbi:MAG: cell division protein ZapA [Magnetococcus sp. DMHC-6]
MTQSVKVRVQGMVFQVKTEEGEAYGHALASYVEDIMVEITRHAKMQGSDRIAIMTALSIADDLLQFKKSIAKNMTTSNEKVQALIATTDQLLNG